MDVVELRMFEAVVFVEVHPDEDLLVDWTGSCVIGFRGIERSDVFDAIGWISVPRVEQDVSMTVFQVV